MAEALGASEVRRYESHDAAVASELSRRTPPSTAPDLDAAAERFQAEMMSNDWLCESTVGHEVGTCLGCISVAMKPALAALLSALDEERRRHDGARRELAAYHKFHEAINGKVGLLRAGYGDPKEHAETVHDAFRALGDERTAIALEADATYRATHD